MVAGQEDEDVDLRRQLPRPDDPPARPASGPRSRSRTGCPRTPDELTVHLHGGHNAASEDGQPGGLTASQSRALYCDLSPATSARAAGNDLLIAPGGSRTYTYDLVEDGAPERAAFQWYHDHRLERTAKNVWRGLAGMMIIDDAVDAALPLPRGERDIPLMLADRSLTKKNQLTDPFGPFANAPDDGVSGELILVNGVHHPYHRVSATRHRLRILNASNFRSYNLELKGAKMTQIATESGLMPAPVARRKILVGPGERVEVIADFTAAAGKRVVLRSVKRSDAPEDARLDRVRRRADGVPGRQEGRRHDLDPGRAAAAARLGRGRRRRPRRRPGSSRSRPASARPGSSTARRSTPSAPTRSRSSARPRPGGSRTRPRSPT